LVHKSQIADRYVAHPMDIVSLWQSVEVRVLEIDLEREKVSLSMKTEWWSQVSSSWAKRSGVERSSSKPTPTKTGEVKDTPSTLGGNINWG
jgi:transcriptional accessory protein Tex/SPT6